MVDDRFDADLRAALHHEMAMTRIGVSAPQIRTGIAARERRRRSTRAALLGIAALLAIAVATPMLAPLAQRALAPDRPTEAAVTVHLDATGDLVVETTPFAGPPVETARLPRAAEWLRPTVDPSRLQPRAAGTVIAFHPDGYLAVAVSAADEKASPVAVLVWDLARPTAEPVRLETTADGSGRPVIGWTADGRLVVAADVAVAGFDVLDPRTRGVVSVTISRDTVDASGVFLGAIGTSTAGGSITSTPDGEIVVVMTNPGTFESTVATLELPRGGGAGRATEGLPAAVWSVTGLERTWGTKGGVVGGLGSANDISIAGVQVGRPISSSDAPDAQAWSILGPGEQVVGQPVWDATTTGIWLLQATGRRLDLVHLDGPGLASARATLPGDGTTDSSRNAIVGVAADGRGVVVRGAAGDLFVDGLSGRRADLPTGARFVGWSRAATTPTPEERPFCEPVENQDLAGTRIAGPHGTFVGGLPAGMGGAAYANPRPATDAWGLVAAQTVAGAGLRLLLPDGACASLVTAEAVPVDDPAATPLTIDASDVTPGGPGGVLSLAEPSPGRWIVRVRLAVAGRAGSSIASLLYRVDVGAEAPSPSSGTSSSGGRLVSDGPQTGSLPGSVVPLWTIWHGRADAPADGVSSFRGLTSPPLRAGPVVTSLACTGGGEILVAAATAADLGSAMGPAADRWTRIACADLPRDAAPVTVNLPDARGAETALIVERRPTRADDLLGYSVVVGQPVDIACDTPTPELAGRIGLRPSPDTRSQAGTLVGYELPAGSRTMAAGELVGAASLPPLSGPASWQSDGWSLTLPAGLCATGWSMQEAEAGAAELTPGSSARSSDSAVVGRMTLSLRDPGDWTIAVTLALQGPHGTTGSASLLWHVDVTANASPTP